MANQATDFLSGTARLTVMTLAGIMSVLIMGYGFLTVIDSRAEAKTASVQVRLQAQKEITDKQLDDIKISANDIKQDVKELKEMINALQLELIKQRAGK